MPFLRSAWLELLALLDLKELGVLESKLGEAPFSQNFFTACLMKDLGSMKLEFS